MFARVTLVLVTLAVAWAVFARGTGASAPEHTYTVKPADTLWSIAASEYGGDPRAGVWKIRERNHLLGTMLRPGQRLRLP